MLKELKEDVEKIKKTTYEQNENIFIEEALIFYEDEATKDEKATKTIKDYLLNVANEDKKRIKSETSSKTGAFYQKEIALGKYENYYHATINEYHA